jgi:hypothetical protein
MAVSRHFVRVSSVETDRLFKVVTAGDLLVRVSFVTPICQLTLSKILTDF